MKIQILLLIQHTENIMLIKEKEFKFRKKKEENFKMKKKIINNFNN